MKYYLILLMLIFSCSSKKDILLLQDIDKTELSNVNYSDIIIKNDDILRIIISSPTPELSSNFNSFSNFNSPSIDSYQINGYQVNSTGEINLPSIGSIKVAGLTVVQLVDLLGDTIKKSGQLLNPSIDVKIVNAYFTILGEVNNPGRYNFIKNNMDLLQAIGIAGDLKITGERKNIKIIRRSNADSLKVSFVDLTSSNFINSNDFQIFPGDIIIVDPNNSRVKNAGIIGNAGNLLSLLSFVLSSIILITSN